MLAYPVNVTLHLGLARWSRSCGHSASNGQMLARTGVQVSDAVIGSWLSSRRGVGRTLGWGLRLSIRLHSFVGRLILVADGSPHRSQVPGAQPLEAIRRRSAHLIGDR